MAQGRWPWLENLSGPLGLKQTWFETGEHGTEAQRSKRSCVLLTLAWYLGQLLIERYFEATTGWKPIPRKTHGWPVLQTSEDVTLARFDASRYATIQMSRIRWPKIIRIVNHWPAVLAGRKWGQFPTASRAKHLRDRCGTVGGSESGSAGVSHSLMTANNSHHPNVRIFPAIRPLD